MLEFYIMPHLNLVTLNIKMVYNNLICPGVALNAKFRVILTVLLIACTVNLCKTATFKRLNIVFQDNYVLMQIKSIAESILQYF